MRRYGLMVVLAAVLLSCGDGRPKGLLKADKMEKVLWDVIRANTYVTQYLSRDTSRSIAGEQIKYQQKVFAFHKISKEDFYTSYDYYLSHPGAMGVVLDSIISKANAPKIFTRQDRFSPVK